MWNITVETTVIIAGCPDSGIAAVDWRREHGIPDSPDARLFIHQASLADEQLVRELAGLGYRPDAGLDLRLDRYSHGWPRTDSGTYHDSGSWVAEIACATAQAYLASPAAGVAGVLREIAGATAARARAEAAARAAKAEAEAAKQVAHEAEQLAYIEALEADPWRAIDNGKWRTFRLPGATFDGDGYDLAGPLRPRLKALRQREESRMRAEQTAIAAAAAAQSAARLARLAEIVRAHGSESAQERLAAGPAPLGLLPLAEAEEIALDWALPATGPTPAYVPITASEVRRTCSDQCACAGEHECGVTFEAAVAEEIDAATWSRVVAMRAALAEAGIEESEIVCHRGQCGDRGCAPDQGEGVVTRYSVRATRDLGAGVVVERSYAV